MTQDSAFLFNNDIKENCSNDNSCMIQKNSTCANTDGKINKLVMVFALLLLP